MSVDEYWRGGGSTEPEAARRTRELRCGYCGELVPRDRHQRALIRDSSVVHPDDPGRDGQRQVIACGSEHLQWLIDQARGAWVVEQLWFRQLCRASVGSRMTDASLWRVSEAARLSSDQLHRALEWNAHQEHPRSALPGGHRLPDSRGP